MYHVKALVVDSLLVSVGSTNFDNRSFTLNDEANLNVLDADFARQQETVFENDWRRALPVSLRQWEDRPLFDKAAGKLADLVSPQL
jgi:cardiolipin synthase